jgi:hypothetical protein
MKLKEILKNNVYSHFDGTNPTLTGSGLDAITPFFNDIEEFNGKNIEVIHSLDNLVTVKGVENLGENVKIQTLFLIDDDVFIRCTSDSLKTLNENIKQQKLYSEEVVELVALEMVSWAIENIGNISAQSGKKFDEVLGKYKNK